MENEAVIINKYEIIERCLNRTNVKLKKIESKERTVKNDKL